MMNQTPKNKKGANQIRILRYPALIDGNDSFPLGDYQVSHEGMAENYSLILRHEIRAASLIENFIKEQKAVYACAVASPRTAYREIQISTCQLQEVSWNLGDFGEPPCFTPMIICKEEIKYQLRQTKDEVHENWDGEEVVFPKGAFLAVYSVKRLKEAGFEGLIHLRPDKRVEGQFCVDIDEDSTFKFDVRCKQDFYDFVTQNRNDKRRDIVLNIVTACFACLQQQYKEERPQGEEETSFSYKELDALSHRLKKKGYCDWRDSEFHPEQAATLLHPHNLIQRNNDE